MRGPLHISTGVEMFTRGRRAALIYSALLSALVISCGELTQESSRSSPPATSTHTNGKPDDGGPPKGAPPGTELVYRPGGGISLEDWKGKMNSACIDAGYKAGCLPIAYDTKGGDDPNKEGYTKCNVNNVSPGPADRSKYVKDGTKITLTVSCNFTRPPSQSPSPKPKPGEEVEE